MATNWPQLQRGVPGATWAAKGLYVLILSPNNDPKISEAFQRVATVHNWSHQRPTHADMNRVSCSREPIPNMPAIGSRFHAEKQRTADQGLGQRIVAAIGKPKVSNFCLTLPPCPHSWWPWKRGLVFCSHLPLLYWPLSGAFLAVELQSLFRAVQPAHGYLVWHSA